MNKNILTLGAALFISAGLHGAKVDDIRKQLQDAASTFGMQALNKNLSTAQQNASLSNWEKAFKNAKAFVIDNSKDLLGRKDSALIKAMSELEKINTDLINTIKVIRGTLPNAPISRLLGIKMNAKNTVGSLSASQFTLGSKKEAANIIIAIGRFIEEASVSMYNALL